MKASLSANVKEVASVAHVSPSVSVIIPFEPKMMDKATIASQLSNAIAEVDRQISLRFEGEMGKLVMQKLKNAIAGLNYTTYRKSIAIYVSPVYEKVLYLQMEVEPRIIVDESFEIRDLVSSKLQQHRYLVLLLKDNGYRLFFGNDSGLFTIISYKSPSEDPVHFFSEYMKQIDSSLDIILKANPLPLFIAGGQLNNLVFTTSTRHKGFVVKYINYSDSMTEENEAKQLFHELLPSLGNWEQIRSKHLFNRLCLAAADRKLAIGLTEAWRQANQHNASLLVVERDFVCPAFLQEGDTMLVFHPDAISRFSHIKDAVDDVMEKVLVSGGEVEFVEPGFLKSYQRIALIQQNNT